MLHSLSLHYHHHLHPSHHAIKNSTTLTPPLLHRHRHRRRPISSASDPPTSAASFPDSTIRRISDKLRRLGFHEEEDEEKEEALYSGAGEIFLPTPRELPSLRVGHTLYAGWSVPEGRRNESRERKATAADVRIGAKELRRLRTVGIKENRRMKIGKAGITEGIVNAIHERWRSVEVVKIKCEDLCRMNMERTHDILERKTGGLVVWRSGSIIILYRGVDYKYPYFTDGGKVEENRTLPSVPSLSSGQGENSISTYETTGINVSKSRRNPSLVMGVGSPKKLRFQLPGEAQLVAEAEQLLDGLGPRFSDWWGYGPLPVDADILPGVVPGFRRPFRLLPFGVQPKLTDREMTTLRRLAHPLPFHFAIGRNMQLQGLAASIIKLWERCEIAKIAVKRGTKNVDPESTSLELKQLTGGTLLSRNNDSIVLYRGKDFLPLAVSHAIEERRKNMLNARVRTNGNSFMETRYPDLGSSEPVAPELLQEANSLNLSSEGEKSSPKLTAKSLEVRLSMEIEEKGKTEKVLGELEGLEGYSKPDAVMESITQEERYMLKKVGLRMKPFLLLGRLGAFDGTVENMHLHWKYRELVKIIARNRPAKEVHATARTLEAASGGILVGVGKLSRGYAIIMYRGKNYRRPESLRPSTLVNKREARKKYLENQHRESLNLRILKPNQDIERMKHDLMRHEEAVPSESDHSSGISKSLNNSVPVLNAEMSSEEEISKHDTGISKVLSVEERSNYSLGRDKQSIQLASRPSFRASVLSNKDRLILRKQALKMRKRPVLSVGKNNAITGVAKAITVHFRKHPLAIVNIKSVAKDTSVQDIISELEKATGSVFVSREPNKIILFRGWGEGKEPNGLQKEKMGNADAVAEDDVSHSLLDAIKMESGIKIEPEEKCS